MYKLLTALLTLLITSGVYAAKSETAYVTDHIVITLRKGQGTEFQILRTLPSGTPLVIMESNKKTGYTRVHTQDGTEGWVPSQYLSETPSVKDQLEAAQKKLASLETEHKQLLEEASQLRNSNQQLEEEWNALLNENGQITDDLSQMQTFALASTPPATNNQVGSKALVVKKEMQILRQENQALKDRSDKDWFLLGAAVFFIGILAGIILPKFRKGKKTGW